MTMLHLFTRSLTASASIIKFQSHSRLTYITLRAMASNQAANDQLQSSKLFDVSHCTAVVTGGGTGIGLMITQALVANGAKVYITGRREEALDNVVKTYGSSPGSIHALPGDVSNKNDITRLADRMAKEEPDGIQLLVNNAGIARDQLTQFSKNNGPPDMKDADAIHNYFIKSDPQAWEDTFRTNVTGQFFMSIAFLPLLKKGADTAKKQNPLLSSSIINVSSISGSMKGTSGGQPAYAASKAASSHVTRMLATTLKDVGVRVNCIAPGLFPSEVCTATHVDRQTHKVC